MAKASAASAVAVGAGAAAMAGTPFDIGAYKRMHGRSAKDAFMEFQQ